MTDFIKNLNSTRNFKDFYKKPTMAGGANDATTRLFAETVGEEIDPSGASDLRLMHGEPRPTARSIQRLMRTAPHQIGRAAIKILGLGIPSRLS